MYQVKVQAEDIAATSPGIPGVTLATLHKDEATGAMSVIRRLAPGATIPAHSHTYADETVYVLEGDFIEDGIAYGPGAVFFGKAKTPHGPHHSRTGCAVLTHFSAALDFVPLEQGKAS